MNKEIPHNIEAEQSVIGAMLLSKYALQKAVESLSEENFYLEKHSKIFEAIKDMANDHIAIDMTTLTNKLKDQKELNLVGGVEYLSEILELTPTAANVDHYIKIVEDKSVLRRLIEESTAIATLGYSTDLSINETLDRAESKILNVVKNRKSTEFKMMPEILTEVQNNLEKLATQKGKISGLSSGFYDFDRLTDGFHENELIILAARPAMGKTALALNVASNIALNTTKSVIVFTLEMRAEQLVSRMISSIGQIDARKLQNGNLENKDWKSNNEAISQLTEEEK